LEWMFKPESREPIQVLSKYYVDFQKGSVLFDPSVDPDVLSEIVRLKHFELVSDLFIKEPTVGLV